MAKSVFRREYRAQLSYNLPEGLDAALQAAKENCDALIAAGKLMTCGLFRHEGMIFAYVESLETELTPADLFGAVEPFLADWPGQAQLRKWVPMTPAFYHAIPVDEDDWNRDLPLELRRGRLAFLKPDRVFEYAHSHKELTNAGDLTGDKFLFISLNENILFNYGEGRMIITNIKRNPEEWEAKTGHPRKIGEFPPFPMRNPDAQPFIPWPDGTSFNYIETLFVCAKMAPSKE